jgi:hypothetical protein
VTDNDEVPNTERSAVAARVGLVLILLFIAGTLAGVWVAP